MSADIFSITSTENESTSTIPESNIQSPDWNDPVTILLAIVFTFLTAGTILQNAVLLIAVTLNKHLRQSLPNFFIVNLAVADLLVGLIVIPFSAWVALSDHWPFGSTFCVIWSAMHVWCCCASISSLCVIAVDRYIAVTRPLSYPQIMTHRRHLYLIFGVWFLSGYISIVPIVIYHEIGSTTDMYCFVNSKQHHILTTALGAFFIPMIIILVLYWRIYKEAARVGKSLRIEQENRNRGISVGVTAASLRIHVGRGNNLSPQNPAVKFIKERKAAWTVGIITSVFIICWFPFFTVFLLSGFNVDFDGRDRLMQILVWLGYSNSCLSPIIYVATSKKFKNTFIRCTKQFCLKSKL